MGFVSSFFCSFDFCSDFVSASSINTKTLPFETLSPILTFKEEIFPASGDGTSTLDLSLSKDLQV